MITGEQVAAILAYVAPGYVFLRIIRAFLPPRSADFAEMTLASVVLSLPWTFAARWLLSAFGFDTTSDNVPVLAMIVAGMAAVVVGAVARQRPIRRAVARLTSLNQTRIWIPLLDEHNYYLQVQVDTGRVFFGYARQASNDPSADSPDLYLEDVETVDALGHRTPLENTRGLFIPGPRVRAIQFLKPGPRPLRAT